MKCKKRTQIQTERTREMVKVTLAKVDMTYTQIYIL